MGWNYLKKYYLQDEKLAQRARLEFFRALRTRRMVAFLGSMATQAHGYGSWDQLSLLFALATPDPVKKNSEEWAQIEQFWRRSQGSQWNIKVGMSMIEEVVERSLTPLHQDDDEQEEEGEQTQSIPPAREYDWPLDRRETHYEQLRANFASAFRQPRDEWRIDRAELGPPTGSKPVDFAADCDVIGALWNKLGIRRFATTNYDFEIERVAMLDDRGPVASHEPFRELVKLRNETGESLSWDLGSGRIRRTFSDGWAIESDLLNRERIDRMIEFAIGTDDVDGHVMHLHGRACNPASMIVTQRDYDRLYRRDDLNRLPFEYARRMLMGGNPIVFVGLGMNEAELNRELQEFISNNPFQRVAPTFLLWSARTAKMSAEAMKAFRIDKLRQLGVLTIFDEDIGPTKARFDRTLRPRPYPDKYRNFDADPGAAGERLKLLGRAKSLAAKEKDDERSALKVCKKEKLTLPASLADTRWLWADSGWREDLKDLKSCVDVLAGPKPSHAQPVRGQADTFRDPSERERHVGRHWRSMAGIVQRHHDSFCEQGKPPSAPLPLVLWEPEKWHEGPNVGQPNGWVEQLAARQSHNIICIIGPQGCGKGLASKQLAADPRALFRNPLSKTLLINGCFCFDTDSLLDCVARFLVSAMPGQHRASPGELPKMSRSELFRSFAFDQPEALPKLPWTPLAERPLIVLNGSERFFDTQGQPLSAELDEMLNLVRSDALTAPGDKDRAKLRMVIFGTERVRPYMERLGATVLDFGEVNPVAAATYEKLKIPSFFLDALWKGAKGSQSFSKYLDDEIEAFKANAAGKISGDGLTLRRATFHELFDDKTLANLLKIGPTQVVRARVVLRALAFIGLPVEREVLQFAPAISRAFKDDESTLKTLLEKLVKAGLVLSCRGFCSEGNSDSSGRPRYVLHRAILTELRQRFGIPMTEAKLSTAFNMSLYIAQPIDGDIPDHDIHDELGETVDSLIGAYRTTATEDEIQKELAALRKKLGDQGLSADREQVGNMLLAVARACGDSLLSSKTPERLQLFMARLCGEDHVASLRAALAVIRGYYSTTGLLTVDSGDRVVREGRDGVLLEHAERLDDLIDAYGKCALAREKMREQLGASAEAAKGFSAIFGAAEPFYADELVWLHNERGVVRLAMGDLYEARRSFDMALRVNRESVEFNDRAHNWRRIRLNQITLDVEMGDISLAERKCHELKSIIDEKSSAQRLREDLLCLAMVEGFLGWIEHLRGRLQPALSFYEPCCRHLSKLGEVRAQAYFERLRGNAYRSIGDPRGRETLERALDLAESATQMDLVHRLRIDLADDILFSIEPTSEASRRRAHRYLEDAHTYALHADVPRIRMEAAMSTSRARSIVSDHEGALRYLSDALMVATRYGMVLRQITLRARLARIMAERGHPVTAENLARTCIKMATRLRFQTAIDRATKVIADIPRLSADITKTDLSGRRNY